MKFDWHAWMNRLAERGPLARTAPPGARAPLRRAAAQPAAMDYGAPFDGLAWEPVVELASRRLTGLQLLLPGTDGPHAWRNVAGHRDHAPQGAGTRALVGACWQLGQWRAAGLAVKACLPVAAMLLARPEFPHWLACLLGDAGLAATRIELALSPSEVGPSTPLRSTQAHAVLRHGVGFALLGFGAGPADLATLHHFPLRRVELDEAITARLAQDEPASADAVRELLKAFAGLGLTGNAAGIASEAQCDTLLRLGLKRGRGPLFAPAMDAAEATRWLQRQVEDDGRSAPAAVPVDAG